MKISALLVALAASSVVGVALPKVHERTTELEALIASIENTQLEALKTESEALVKRGVKPTCHIGNVAIRREYGSLSKRERLNYIAAVKCLQRLPPKTPASVAAGAKSRFDDFIVTHMQQTLTIHYTGNFLGWHRWFLWVYEQALRNECGYKGYAPYWDWPKYASAPQDSPIFNGDKWSLGGNGKYVPSNGTLIVPPPGVAGASLLLPSGLGGGCVETGPFKDQVVNLGPVGLASAPVGPDGGFGWNPRCLKRDVGPAIALRYTNATSVFDLLTAPDLLAFRTYLEGIPYSGPEIGPHGGGHFAINGDPGGDLFTSPGDPVFWLHHAQVDRMWTFWQALNPAKRQYALIGTDTWTNVPPSPLTTLDSVVDIGYSGASIRLGDTMSTTKGPLCYIYL